MARTGQRRGVMASILGLTLVAAVVAAPPSIAHSFTKRDANDSPGRLDIKAASVGHKGTSVVHTVKTYDGWKPPSLGNDSFFIVEIDTNFDADFERCAFIFYSGRLRGSLTNCGQRFIRSLDVGKPSKTTAKVSIPRSALPGAYRWVVFSFWKGAPAKCADVCFDAAPNRPPPILHDLTPPEIAMQTTDLRVGVTSTSADFEFPFDVTDEHAGVASWTVQSRPLDRSTAWTTVATGAGGGARSPLISGTEGSSLSARVIATDEQGNTKIGPTRRVLVPIDDDQIDPAAFTGEPTVVSDAEAFGGSYQSLDAGESVTFEASGFDEFVFELMGPGTGDWAVDVSLNGSSLTTLDAATFDDAQRQLLIDVSSGSTVMTISFTVTAGSGFGIDSFVMPI